MGTVDTRIPKFLSRSYYPNLPEPVRRTKSGLRQLGLLAVTTQPPQSDGAALEIPDREASLAGGSARLSGLLWPDRHEHAFPALKKTERL